MNNQVISYDRMTNVVKLIDGIKTISLKRAQQLGFTPAYLIQMAHQLLALDNNDKSKQALALTKSALAVCPATKWDDVRNIVSYDRMSNKIRIFGGAITVPFKIAMHKGITPAHMMQMACQLLSVNHDANALQSAKKAYEACKLAQASQPKYKNKRYR